MKTHFGYSAALLPTHTTMNPAHPEDAEYYNDRQVAYVVKNVDTGTLRCLTSYGIIDWDLGFVTNIHHDQTGRHLGTFKVIGIRDFAMDYRKGEIPNRKLAHWVFK